MRLPLVKSGAGTWALSGVNTFTGNTTISAGTLQIGGSGSLNSGNYAGAIADNGTLQYSSSANQTLSGVISGSGALTKDTSAASALTLSNANTYTGTTTLTAGTLNINNATALGTGTFIVNGGTIDNTSAGAITLTNNNVQTWGGNFAFTGTQNLNLGTGAVGLGAATRTVTVNGGDLTVGGIISGSAGSGLAKAGTGNLMLSGANTFTGATLINAGKLTAGAVNILSTSSGVTVASGATLNLNGFNQTITNLNLSGTLAGTGGETLTLSGAGNILGANQTFNGTLDLSNATLSLAGFNLTLGTLEITGTSVIDFGGSSCSAIRNTAVLVRDAGATLTVNNWNDQKEYFYTASNPGGATALSQITFGTPYSGDTTKWLSYNDGPDSAPAHQITPSNT